MFENIDQKGAVDVFTNSGWLTYLAVMIVSLWGGLVSYFGKNSRKFSWRGLLAHLSSASFAGFITALACQYAGVTGPLIGVLCAVAGHMGTPALIALAMKLKFVRNLLADADEGLVK